MEVMALTRAQRIDALKHALQKRVLVVDGAMGTQIQSKNLTAEDFGGPQYEGCNEYLVITRPDVIKDIHRGYLAAGADILETDSFGSTPLVLAEYGLGERAREISAASARIAREVADEFSETPSFSGRGQGIGALPGPTLSIPRERVAVSGGVRFVAGSIGPTTKSIFVTGGITWDKLAENYQVQAAGLIDGGADFLLVETSQDILNVKAALEGIDRAFAETGITIPVAVQGTVETMGTLLCGQDVDAFYTAIAHRDLLWVGINCATGPQFMTDHIRSLAAISRFPIACIPNAGLPDENGRYNETPEMMGAALRRFGEAGWLNVVGGCCGTEPEHIRKIAALARDLQPRKLGGDDTTRISGLETLLIDEDTRPVLVGERTNVLGSRLFKRLIAEGKLDEAAEIGRRQVRGGAHCLDVCLQDPDRDEVADVNAFLDQLTRKIKVPLVLDSTDAHVLEEALKRTPGKCIINSINLEDGEERFKIVVPLARRFGAALVVGCIDEDKLQAQAVTRQRKLEIARRSFKLLTEKYGIPPQDIIFDPLVFPIGTGDKNYIGAGVETIEGIRLIKGALPQCKTILGISNVSFGLPTAGREVLNAVMLYHCVRAGLDAAIVNTERLERYASLPEEDKRVSEDLIWWRGDDPIATFAAHFRERKSAVAVADRSLMPLNERLARCIIDGTKEGLIGDLDLAMGERSPLEIINGPLMAGMDEVGRLFNANAMIVAEVLQSAEAMKAAVAHLEPHMEKADSASKGKIILATVKGDVHDIGKNLVEIILSNNGYQVINLGIKVPPQDLIAAYEKHHPDAIGLSGLLVKSAQMMVETAKDLTTAGIQVPMLVGGAALSNKFTRLRIAPEYRGLVAYAKDAMNGLDLANRLRSPESRGVLSADLARTTRDMLAAEKPMDAPEPGPIPNHRSPHVRQDVPIPNPPDLKLHVLRTYDLDRIFRYINPMMLYVRHLGYRGRYAEDLAAGEAKAVELRGAVQRVEEIMLAAPGIEATAVFRFFPAQSDGQHLVVYESPGGPVKERFLFGRQREGEGLSLVDYIAENRLGRMDYVGMFVTSIGPGVRALADEWKAKGDYLASHILQSLALEGAEGFAELLHQQMRRAWGFPDPAPSEGRVEGAPVRARPAFEMDELFKAHYQGRRYSFGYPACPRLEDQAPLFRLLEVERHIPTTLTEGYMMDPESSVSALVFHHPDAKYFNLGPADIRDLEHAAEGKS